MYFDKLLIAVLLWVRWGAVHACTPFSYDIVTECQAALASGNYDSCSTVPYLSTLHPVCELQAPADYTALLAIARILTTEVHQACGVTDCSTPAVCVPVQPDAYECVPKETVAPVAALVITDAWETDPVYECSKIYATAGGTACPYKSWIDADTCVADWISVGGGKSFSGCSSPGCPLAATEFMKRMGCCQWAFNAFTMGGQPFPIIPQNEYCPFSCPTMPPTVVGSGGRLGAWYNENILL